MIFYGHIEENAGDGPVGQIVGTGLIGRWETTGSLRKVERDKERLIVADVI